MLIHGRCLQACTLLETSEANCITASQIKQSNSCSELHPSRLIVMATEDDNFDIDIYGDGGYNNDQGDYKHDDSDLILDTPENVQTDAEQTHEPTTTQESARPRSDSHQTYKANGEQTSQRQTPVPSHGVKRKEYDDRHTDADATTALLVSDLFWWTTDDDIRGWVNEADCEDELKDVTFSEHKVNGKSKG